MSYHHLLARLSVDHRRTLAKTLYRVGGRLSRIKTYQRYYTFDPTEWLTPEDAPLASIKPAGRHWTSCSLSMRMLTESMQLDWEHWDHWATQCQHARCDGAMCPECGGIVCPDEWREDVS